MRMKNLNNTGFSVFELILGLVVVIAVGGGGFLAFQEFQERQRLEQPVEWAFDEQKLEWFTKSGVAPKCPEPFKFTRSPIDISQVTAVLLPGAYRGYSYKPHGGFGTPEQLGGKVNVVMPMDATLIGLTRYYEGAPPDLQYLLTFESDCGIAFRFDHLYTLSPKLQKIAEQTPEPKLNDTRSTPDANFPRLTLKAGELVATQTGLPSMKIFGFDFGVYDYRSRNEISKNSQWAALHNQYQALDWYGVCWFDMLPGDAPDKVKGLSLLQTDTRKEVKKVSDYCPNAPYRTLDINEGKPTDG